MGVCIRDGRKLIKGECIMCNWTDKYFKCGTPDNSEQERR